MKTVMLTLIAGVVLTAFAANASLSGSNFPAPGKGYIAIDRTIVLLPSPLQWGDRLVMYNIQGKKVLEEFVGNGYLAANLSKLPTGVYTVTIVRKNSTIAAERVPIMGIRRG